MIVIVDTNQISKLQVTSCTSRFASNTLHSTSIAEEAVCVVVDKIEPRLVEYPGGVSLRDSKTDSVAEPLTKRAGSDLNTWSVMGLGVTRSDAVYVLKSY